jgi:hypothetical protein
LRPSMYRAPVMAPSAEVVSNPMPASFLVNVAALASRLVPRPCQRPLLSHVTIIP